MTAAGDEMLTRQLVGPLNEEHPGLLDPLQHHDLDTFVCLSRPGIQGH